MKGYLTHLELPKLCSSVPLQPLWQAKNVHTSTAYFDPIGTLDLWKENPLGLLRSTFLVSGC